MDYLDRHFEIGIFEKRVNASFLESGKKISCLTSENREIVLSLKVKFFHRHEDYNLVLFEYLVGETAVVTGASCIRTKMRWRNLASVPMSSLIGLCKV